MQAPELALSSFRPMKWGSPPFRVGGSPDIRTTHVRSDTVCPNLIGEGMPPSPPNRAQIRTTHVRSDTVCPNLIGERMPPSPPKPCSNSDNSCPIGHGLSEFDRGTDTSSTPKTMLKCGQLVSDRTASVREDGTRAMRSKGKSGNPH